MLPICQCHLSQVFGSYATDMYLPTSDIDCVVLNSGCTDVAAGLRALATAALRRNLAKNIQVSNREALAMLPSRLTVPSRCQTRSLDLSSCRCDLPAPVSSSPATCRWFGYLWPQLYMVLHSATPHSPRKIIYPAV